MDTAEQKTPLDAAAGRIEAMQRALGLTQEERFVANELANALSDHLDRACGVALRNGLIGPSRGDIMARAVLQTALQVHTEAVVIVAAEIAAN